MDILKAKEVLPYIEQGMGIAFSSMATYEGIKAAFNMADEGYGKSYILDKSVPLKQKAKTMCKYHWRMGLYTGLSLGCFCASMHGYSAKVAEAASMTSVAAWWKNYAKEYRSKNRELYGEENDKNVEHAITKDYISKNPPKAPSDPNALTFFDPITKQTFEVTPAELDFAERAMNDILCKAEPVPYWFLLKHFRDVKWDFPICNDIGWFLDDTYADFHYWNESFYGHIMFRILRDQYEDTPNGRVYILRFNIEPMLNVELDADVVKDAQDLQGI